MFYAKNVLLVDDNQTNLKILEKLLQNYSEDLNIIQADNGNTALEIFRSKQIDVALVDIKMPRMNGYELCQRIRKTNVALYVPIILITAYKLTSEDRVKGYDAGCDDFITKPVVPDELFARIRSMLRTKSLHDNLYNEQFQLKQEIIEHTKARNALEESESWYKNLFISTNEGIAVNELIYNKRGNCFDYRVLDVNPAYEDITGIKRDNAIGNLASRLYGEVIPLHLDLFEKVNATREPLTFETNFKFLRKSLKISVFSPKPGFFVILFLDITERKEIQNRILESEQRYRQLFNESPIALFEEDFTDVLSELDILKSKGIHNIKDYFDLHPDVVKKYTEMVKIIDVNNAALALHEVADKKQLLGSLDKIFTQDSLEVFKEELIAIAEGKTYFESEAQVKTLSGKTKYIYLRLYLRYIVENNKSFSKALIASSDISDLKNLLNDLTKSESKYRNLTDVSPVGVFQTDNDGSCNFVNRKWTEIVGINSDNAIGQGWANSIYIDDRKWVLTKWLDAVKKGITFKEEFRFQHSDGKIVWVISEAKPNADEGGNLNGYIGIITDISDRKLMEDSLLRNEAFLNQTGSVAKVGGWEFDVKSKILNWTVETFHIYELPLDYKPTFDDLTQFTISQDSAIIKSAISKAIKHGSPFDLEVGIVTHKGKHLWIHTICRPQKVNGKVTKITGTLQDITDNKNAILALSDSEEKFSCISNTVHDAVIMIDQNGKIIFWNQSAEIIFGVSESNAIGKLAYQLIIPDSNLLEYKSIVQFLKNNNESNNSIRNFEFRAKRNSGLEFIAELSCSNTMFKGEMHVVAVIRDISQRKLDQQALYESKKELQIRNQIAYYYLFLDNSEIYTAITKYAMRLLNSNFGYFGYFDNNRTLVCPCFIKDTRDQSKEYKNIISIQRKDWDDLWGQSLLDKKAYYSNKKLKAPMCFNKINNALFVPIVHMGKLIGQIAVGNKSNNKKYSIKDKELLMTIVGSIAPILQARLEKKLESEKRIRLATAVEQIAEAILITDNKGLILYANPSLEKITGYTIKEIIGKNPRFMSSGIQNKSFYDTMWNTIKKGEIWKGRIKNSNKNKQLFEAELTISPIRNDNDKIENYVAIYYDISKEAKLEKQLRQAQKMEAIGTLAGGIAHDFNNILQGIFMSVYLAKNSLPEKSIEKQFLDQTEIFGKRGADLVNQILTFSRQSDEKFATIRILPVIKEVVKMMRSTLPSTIEIREKLPLSTDCILGSVTQIHQVIMNLFTNAGSAMGENGGILGIELNEVYFSSNKNKVIGLENKKYLKFTVSDTGLGMSSEIQEQIFNPFYSTKPVGEGTGLGLSVVHGIIKSHKGTITVKSEIGVGTTFDVYLPIVAEHAKDNKNEKTLKSLSDIDRNIRILLVDDEKSIILMCQQVLKSLGYEVKIAFNGNEAMDIFYKHPENFDLIITDQTMPKLTGLELAQNILNDYPSFPILIMTGFSKTLDKNNAIQLGVKGVIQKPLLVDETDRIIRKTLGIVN